ncbi:MAG: glycosyl hydrolase [Acidobacteria bacterium]|nr:MAG: glycosyl hydrolase [Acidobacteriota bacterium]
MRRAILRLFLCLPLVLNAQSDKQKPKAAPPAADKAAAATVTAAMLKTLSARAIGPAVMGGRISEIAYDPENPWTFYVAAAHGGLLKTTDNGASFSSLTEKEAIASTGAVAVAPSNAKILWLGTGEANDRNSSGWGTGVYRSTDAGGSWTPVGLEKSRSIARIVVHPKDPDTAYVAVAGDLWTPTPDRGLYKTTDGGKTWKAVLQAESDKDKAGCGDVAIDPSNPETVYAVLYARRRTPWSFVSGPDATGGKDLGGVFRTTDGGATWKKLTGGLPAATGRIGLAVFAKNPNIVYAVVQSAAGGTSNIDDVTSKAGGVFRSDDGGDTWQRQSNLDPRPFYFSQIRVDPQDDKKVYVLGFILHVSEDGGKTWREDRFKNVHSDCHALAIDPRTPERLLLGTDGGVYESYNRGANWNHLATIALGEFYRISTDNSDPYRVCGGLQDNLNWVGPSATHTKDGIVNADWINIQGGDGFYCIFDPKDPNVVYAESQGAAAHRFNLKSGAVKFLQPQPAEGQTAFRFHWNSPFIQSPHDPNVMYLAGNRVFKLTNHGESWQPISADLSTNNPERTATVGSGAETYGVVFALAESPVKAGMLWAGTDDGKVWVTEDGGGKWTDLTPALPVEAKGQWIARIEPGHTDDKTAYLVVNAYQTGNYAPLVYRTTDLGRSWQSIASNLSKDWPARVVREDPSNPDLLFAGTEAGLFVSVDRGSSWQPLGNLPTVRVDDVLVHPREHDLVIATHGRSLSIIDDIRPLEMLTPQVAQEPAHLFPIAPATAHELLPGWVDSSGTIGVFRGVNAPAGAIITVYVKEFTGDAVSLAIKSPDGTPVATLSAPGTPGFNRVTWDLKPGSDVLNPYGGQGQKFVRPGEYEVTLSYGKVSQKEKVRVSVAEGIETR